MIIHNALNEKPLPIYEDGQQVRDWLYVSDHCSAISAVLTQGKPGEVYNVGGNNEMANLDVVKIICGLLDELKPRSFGKYEDLISSWPTGQGMIAVMRSMRGRLKRT